MTSLAIVLLVIVALIGIILFTPITYSFDIVTRRPYRCEIRIQWLKKVLLIHFAYHQGKPLFKEVYILGKAKMGPARDYEDWLNQRVQEETNSSDEEEESVASQTSVKDGDASKYATEPEAKEPSSVRFNNRGEVVETISEQPAEANKQEPKQEESKKSADEKKFDHMWWYKHITNPAFYDALFLVTRRCFDHTKPTRFFVEGEFGMNKPHVMGLIAGSAYSLWADHMDAVTISYTSYVCKGSLYTNGRIQLGVLAYHGTRFIVTKAVREFGLDAAKAGLHYLKMYKAWKKKQELKQQAQ